MPKPPASAKRAASTCEKCQGDPVPSTSTSTTHPVSALMDEDQPPSERPKVQTSSKEGRGLTDEHLLELSKEVMDSCALNEWGLKVLRLEQNAIDAANHDHQDRITGAAHALLKDWQKKQTSSGEALRNLADGLRMIGCNDLAMGLEQGTLLNEISSEPSKGETFVFCQKSSKLHEVERTVQNGGEKLIKVGKVIHNEMRFLSFSFCRLGNL